jgi:hypothetical protein
MLSMLSVLSMLSMVSAVSVVSAVISARSLAALDQGQNRAPPPFRRESTRKQNNTRRILTRMATDTLIRYHGM